MTEKCIECGAPAPMARDGLSGLEWRCLTHANQELRLAISREGREEEAQARKRKKGRDPNAMPGL